MYSWVLHSVGSSRNMLRKMFIRRFVQHCELPQLNFLDLFSWTLVHVGFISVESACSFCQLHIQKKEKHGEESDDKKVILPCIKQTIDKIKNILKKEKIKTVFTTDKTIRHISKNPKYKINL